MGAVTGLLTGGSKTKLVAPPLPPTPPPAPTPVSPEVSNAVKKNQQAALLKTPTILTGPQGLTGQASTAKKTLLGV